MLVKIKTTKIKEIIICDENKKDIEEIHKSYLKGLKFHFVKEMKEVIEISITNQKVRGAKNLLATKY